MAEFIRVGNRWLNVRDVHGIFDNGDGTLSIDVKGSPLTINDPDEVGVFADWLKGATVNPEVPPVTVPDCSGMGAADARAAIEGADLVCAIAGASDGTVTAQDPTAGGEVKKRSTVTVTLTAPEQPSTQESDRPREPVPSRQEPGYTGGASPGAPAVLVDEPERQEQVISGEEPPSRRHGKRDRG